MKITAATTKPPYRRPNRSDDWGETESRGWLDEPEFAEYCVLIRDIVHANPKGLWIAGIHRALGENANPRFTMDALRSLQSVGEIEELDSLPLKYIPAVRQPDKRFEYKNTAIQVPRDKITAYGSFARKDNSGRQVRD